MGGVNRIYDDFASNKSQYVYLGDNFYVFIYAQTNGEP